jgi:hypothetical protein
MVNKQGVRGRPFEVGNRYGKGRPAGSRNKATLALEDMLDGEAAGIISKAIELAQAGEGVALRLCMDRLIPPRRERAVRLQLPSNITTAKGISQAMAAVLKAVAQGEITPGEGVQIAEVLEIHRKTTETLEVESRLSELERWAQASRTKEPNENDIPTP